MGKKEDHKTRSFTNDLNRQPDFDDDPDFDLDAYIRQQSLGGKDIHTESEPVSEDRSQFKNAILIFIVFATAFLWFNDWSITQAWSSVFGEEETTSEVATSIPGLQETPFGISNAPAPPAPPGIREIPVITESGLDMSITEYLSTLRDKGYLGDEVSTFSARELYDANVPVSYLDELQSAGFLEDLSFVYISNYYQNQIPLSYLQSLREAGVYEELSFVDVTEFYNNNVPTEYLVKLNEAGYLDELSFVYITSFHNAGVTVEFLDRLKEQGLYEDLNFLDIVDLYERENNGG